MGVPTSEVGYTSAMPRREDHEVRKAHVGHSIKKCIMWILGKKCYSFVAGMLLWKIK